MGGTSTAVASGFFHTSVFPGSTLASQGISQSKGDGGVAEFKDKFLILKESPIFFCVRCFTDMALLNVTFF